MITFRELIESRYLALGMNKIQSFAKVYVDCGVSIKAQRAAFAGTRVAAETARSLCEWAASIHKLELDELAMLQAPTKPLRGRADPGVRAEEAISAALQDTGMPPDWRYTLTFAAGIGLWTVEARTSDGAAATTVAGPDLCEALESLRERIRGPAEHES